VADKRFIPTVSWYSVARFKLYLTYLLTNLNIYCARAGDFMKANIVGTVLFMSAMFWIPVSMVFHRLVSYKLNLYPVVKQLLFDFRP